MSERQDYKLVQLEKDNYVTWKWQMKNILKAKKLESVLLFDNKDMDKDTQALAILGSALSQNEMLKIINCETFKDAWKAIEENYENKKTYEPQSLFARLNSYKINSASEVSQGVSEMKGIVAQLKNLNESVSDNNLIGAILSALPDSFEIFKTVWRNFSDQNLDKLVSKVMAEASVQTSKGANETKALAASKGTNKKGSRNMKVEKDQCRYCKESGHWIKDCPNLKTPHDPNHARKKDRKDDNDKKEDAAQFDLACMSKINQGMLSEAIWVADSGCTNHMTPYKHLFSSFTGSSAINVIRLADENVSLEVQGQGDILTNKCRLKNVLYVPSLSQNLFSISAAASAGLTLIGSKDKLAFMFKERPAFQAELKDKLYLIDLEPKNPIEAHVKSATVKEWHARFNHVSPETIKLMIKNNAVDGLTVVNQSEPKCQECQLNKCTNVHHPTRSTPKTTKAGNVLHIDTSGKSSVISRGGSQYVLLCKDEAPRYRQVAFIATKDQIPNKVKEFISRTMLETGNPVLKLVTDNGTEFVNNDLGKFLQSRGILHECSVPYVAQQNGFVERDMRTIKEMAKTMLTNSKLDKNLWAEAINCAIYTLNRVINNSNSVKTPYEMWHQVKPNVKNLRIFGELAILKKQKSQVKGSWDARGSKAIFVGYTDKFNTYKFIEGSKFVIACDAVFLNKMNDDVQLDENIREEYICLSGNIASESNTSMDISSMIENHNLSEADLH